MYLGFVLFAIGSLVMLSSATTTGSLVTSLPYNFTLAAFNTTLRNENTTGDPLVLGANGASSGATTYVTSTFASYPYNDYPSLGLTDNSLRAFTPSGEWFTNATVPVGGRRLTWLASKIFKPPAAQNYSALLIPGQLFPLLAAQGTAELWSLCTGNGPRAQVNVVFNASAAVGSPSELGFDPATCYSVVLHIVKLQG